MYPFKVQKSETFNVFTELGDHRPVHGEHFHHPENRPCAIQQLLCPVVYVLCASTSPGLRPLPCACQQRPAPPPLCPCNGTPHALPGRKVSTPLRGLNKLLRAQKRPHFGYPLLSDSSLVIKNNNKKMMINKRDNRRRDRGSICCLLQSPKCYLQSP